MGNSCCCCHKDKDALFKKTDVSKGIHGKPVNSAKNNDKITTTTTTAKTNTTTTSSALATADGATETQSKESCDVKNSQGGCFKRFLKCCCIFECSCRLKNNAGSEKASEKGVPPLKKNPKQKSSSKRPPSGDDKNHKGEEIQVTSLEFEDSGLVSAVPLSDIKVKDDFFGENNAKSSENKDIVESNAGNNEGDATETELVDGMINEILAPSPKVEGKAASEKVSLLSSPENPSGGQTVNIFHTGQDSNVKTYSRPELVQGLNPVNTTANEEGIGEEINPFEIVED